jgi:hypothetical protein
MTDIALTTRLMPERAPPAGRDHFVQFYENDATLVQSVGRFIRNGLQSGTGAVVIATQEHLKQIEALWTSEGFDADWARKRNQLVVLDAAETLASLCAGEAPDWDLFDRSVGGVVSGLCERFGHTVAFGEMVGLLWMRGLQTRPFAWNRSGTARRAALLRPALRLPHERLRGRLRAGVRRDLRRTLACHALPSPISRSAPRSAATPARRAAAEVGRAQAGSRIAPQCRG